MQFDEAQKVFIVGAPKCGTTALHDYLGQHPDICASDPKEPNYFSSLIKSFPQTDKEYEEYCFKHWQGEKVVLEASPWNLACDEAAGKIKLYSPDAKIIIMLRHPVEMMYSLHSELSFAGSEAIEEFEKALDLESQRIRLANEQENKLSLKQCYRYMSNYAEQVERFTNLFARDQILFIYQEEFNQNTIKVFNEVLNFIEVNKDVDIAFEKKNKNKKVRSKKVRAFLMQPPPVLRKVARLLLRNQSTQHAIRKKMRVLNKKINSTNTTRSPMNNELYNRLLQEKVEEIKKLQVLLKTDLSDWLRLKK